MRITFLTLFLFVLCTQAISASDLALSFTSEQRGQNPSKSNVKKQEALDLIPNVERRGSTKDIIRMERKVEERKIEEKQEISGDMRKAQRGKGANGGSSDVTRTPPRSINSTSPLLSWISTLVLHTSLALTFLFTFNLF